MPQARNNKQFAPLSFEEYRYKPEVVLVAARAI
jgi:hypothetical protein